MTTSPADPPPTMTSHWWWRPGWCAGRRFYTWHLTFEQNPNVSQLVRAYQAHLDLPGLDLVPEPWLHLTMQGIGFAHEVSAADIDKIVHAARAGLARLEPFDVSLGPAVVDPEVVRLKAAPAALVARLRRQLRAAIADVWGRSRVPEDENDFTPHVSLAYSNREGDMRPILDAAAAISPPPAAVTVRHADLILLHRDHRQYEWKTYAEVPLGGAGSPAELDA